MLKRIRDAHRPLVDITGYGAAPLTRHAALRAVGEVVYAVRVDGIVKIGHTRDFAARFTRLGASDVLAFMPGTYANEQAIHERLTGHLHHGREWYYPTPGVLAVVNEMREHIGLEPLAA